MLFLRNLLSLPSLFLRLPPQPPPPPTTSTPTTINHHKSKPTHPPTCHHRKPQPKINQTLATTTTKHQSQNKNPATKSPNHKSQNKNPATKSPNHHHKHQIRSTAKLWPTTQTHHDQVTHSDCRSTVTRTHGKSVRERGTSKRGQGHWWRSLPTAWSHWWRSPKSTASFSLLLLSF